MQDKPLKPAALSIIQALAIFAVLALAVSSFVLIMTNGAETKQIFTSTTGVADMKRPTDSEIILEYEAEDFYAYFLLYKNEVQPNSLIKKYGLWVFSYPSTKNLYGFTVRDESVYFYDSVSAKGAETVRLLSADGKAIEAVAQQKIKAGAEERIAFVFKIDDYLNYLGDYRLELIDDKGKVAVAADAGLEIARFTLIHDENDLGDLASRKYINKRGENETLWPIVESAAEEALRAGNLEEAEKGPGFAPLRIEAEISRGMSLKLFKKNDFLAWPDTIKYIFEIQEDGAAYVKEIITDYRDATSAEKVTMKEQIRYFKLKQSEMLKSLFAVFN